jgi:hypothetical protein
MKSNATTRAANSILCSRKRSVKANPVFGSEVSPSLQPLFLREACDGPLEYRGQGFPAKLPDGAYEPKDEALDQPRLQDHKNEVRYQTGHSYSGKPACGSSA